MTRYRKAKAVAARREDYYQPSFGFALMALAAAILLLWQGMAQAQSLDETVTAPPATHDTLLLGCRDEMDFTPDEGLPSPMDAWDAAWHGPQHGKAAARLAVRDESGCVATVETLRSL